MIAGVVSFDDLELRLDGTTLWFTHDGTRRAASLATVGEAAAMSALDGIRLAVGDGVSIEDVIAAAEAVAPMRHHMEATFTSEGATILNDAHGSDKDDMAAALRTLVQVTPVGSRSIAVLGQFDCEPSEFVEQHDAIGRLVVRLNVAQLVAVGHGARHLQSAAGLEGSWDGESLIVGTPEEAYDLLRDEIRENDVVLVKGAPAAGLSALAERLVTTGAVQW